MGSFGLMLLAMSQVVVTLFWNKGMFLTRQDWPILSKLAMPGYMIIFSLVLAFALFIPFHKEKDQEKGSRLGD
jgi:hypothetical protein